MKILGIIQARTNSVRLPNKIFKEVCGKPLIWHLIKRLSYSKKLDEIVIATTVNNNDDIIEEFANQQAIKVFRGSEEDVLQRFHGAAEMYKGDIIVRITSDDPFKDPEIIDAGIALLCSKSLDFAYNNHPPTFPEGLDVEVFTFDALQRAQNLSRDVYEREHVTQFFYRNKEQFRQANFSNSKDFSALRLTLDTEADFMLVTEIYNRLYRENEIFLLQDIIDLIQIKPYLKDINSEVQRSAMYKN